mmetsp:Transcript_2928/g.10604  ORF Transcript_2928/g.10604 Transcript_2928/m.10604 type:complete len:257 (-) Transcript_2928:2760-3530(-)
MRETTRTARRRWTRRVARPVQVDVRFRAHFRHGRRDQRLHLSRVIDHGLRVFHVRVRIGSSHGTCGECHVPVLSGGDVVVSCDFVRRGRVDIGPAPGETRVDLHVQDARTFRLGHINVHAQASDVRVRTRGRVGSIMRCRQSVFQYGFDLRAGHVQRHNGVAEGKHGVTVVDREVAFRDVHPASPTVLNRDIRCLCAVQETLRDELARRAAVFVRRGDVAQRRTSLTWYAFEADVLRDIRQLGGFKNGYLVLVHFQ